MTQMSMSDLLSQETLRDPLAFYGRLREQEPLSHFTLGAVGFWIIATTYAESIELLKDPRLEGQIALGTLLQRLPHLRLACEPEQLSWNPVPYLRGLKRLPVTLPGDYPEYEL